MGDLRVVSSPVRICVDPWADKEESKEEGSESSENKREEVENKDGTSTLSTIGKKKDAEEHDHACTKLGAIVEGAGVVIPIGVVNIA